MRRVDKKHFRPSHNTSETIGVKLKSNERFKIIDLIKMPGTPACSYAGAFKIIEIYEKIWF